jgi:hypothetical protein
MAGAFADSVASALAGTAFALDEFCILDESF